MASLVVDNRLAQTQILFQAVRGPDAQSDIAIDDILVTVCTEGMTNNAFWVIQCLLLYMKTIIADWKPFIFRIAPPHQYLA